MAFKKMNFNRGGAARAAKQRYDGRAITSGHIDTRHSIKPYGRSLIDADLRCAAGFNHRSKGRKPGFGERLDVELF
jgi:hypothetical protein